MNLNGKIFIAIGALTLLVAFFIDWASGSTAVESFYIFGIVHLPLSVAALLMGFRQVIPGLAEISSEPVDRLLIVLAFGGHLGASVAAAQTPLDANFGPGFWMTWLLCIVSLALVFIDAASFVSNPVVTQVRASATGSATSTSHSQPPRWVAVPPGTVSAAGAPVPTNAWLAIVSASPAVLRLRDADGVLYDVPGSTPVTYSS